MNSFGKNIRLSIFGESHGQAVGIVVDGLSAGMRIDTKKIEEAMARRRPGKATLVSERKESDEVEIISGVLNGISTGSPITCLIKNIDSQSNDYEFLNKDGKKSRLLRPSHADLPAFLKYGGFEDYRGAGHFSGRLTAPLVFAGSLCKQILLEKYGISVAGEISSILGEKDPQKFDKIILKAKEDGDSVGAELTVRVTNMPAGLGSPFFSSLESQISHILFSIPGVKGVSFGLGFDFANKKGSEANDQFLVKNGKVSHKTNNNGGILGGLSTGEEIIVNIAVKPTPSIAKEQEVAVLSENGEQVSAGCSKFGSGSISGKKASISGRHDPCIAKRAVVVAEMAVAIVILDACYEG